MPEPPPIGIKPRYLHNQLRAIEIAKAILRYLDRNMPIPKEWLNELSDLYGEDK